MVGETHKAIGVATGVAMVLYAVESSNPVYALGMIAAPFGAMFPDIDHHNSKLGRTSNRILSRVCGTIKVISIILLILLILMYNGILSFLMHDIVIKIISGTLLVSAVLLISRSEYMRTHFPFLTRHRGIMHTALIPVIAFSVVFSTSCPKWIAALVIGFSLGYISHLLADSLTVDGTPLAFPITKKPINFMKIKTNTPAEKVAAVILSAAIITFGHMFGSNGESLIVVYAVVLCVVGMGVAHVLAEKVFRKDKRGLFATSVGVATVGYFMESDIRVMFIAFAIGCFLTSMRYIKKK